MSRAAKHAIIIYIFRFFCYPAIPLGVRARLPQKISDVGQQIPQTGIEHRTHVFPAFVYDFSSLSIMTDLQTKSSSLPSCGQLFSPGYVVYFLTGTNEHYNIPITPSSASSSYDLNSIMNCNPWKDAACSSCPHVNKAYSVHFTLIRDDIGALLAEANCLLVIITDCGVNTCSNGEYASEYLQENAHGSVTSHTICLPCAPGTWLTCINDASCSYNIPQANERFYGGTAIYSPAGQVPVGKCFNCSTAASKEHYGKTPYAVKTPPLKTPLPWICPGGALPPKLCQAPYVGSDENNTRCVCSAGSYPIGGDTCAVCSPGTMCPGGVMQVCPDDYYQDQSGATSCNSCLSPTGTAPRCNATSSMRKCTGVFKAQSPQCVSCNMCRREYISDPAGQVDCY